MHLRTYVHTCILCRLRKHTHCQLPPVLTTCCNMILHAQTKQTEATNGVTTAGPMRSRTSPTQHQLDDLKVVHRRLCIGSCCLRKKLGRTQWEFFYPTTVSVMILWYALAHVLQLFRCFGDYTATFISECTVSDQFQFVHFTPYEL